MFWADLYLFYLLICNSFDVVALSLFILFVNLLNLLYLLPPSALCFYTRFSTDFRLFYPWICNSCFKLFRIHFNAISLSILFILLFHADCWINWSLPNSTKENVLQISEFRGARFCSTKKAMDLNSGRDTFITFRDCGERNETLKCRGLNGSTISSCGRRSFQLNILRGVPFYHFTGVTVSAEITTTF